MSFQNQEQIIQFIRKQSSIPITSTTAEQLIELIDDNLEIIRNNFQKDEIIHFYTKLASFLLDQGIKQRDQQRKKTFERIRKIFYRSDHVNISEPRSFLLKGYYYLFQNDFLKAKDHFDNAQVLNNNSLSYWFGKGLIEYHRNNFLKALENFKKIYFYFRKQFPEIYYLMAICFIRLKQYSMAEESLKILLKKDYNQKDKAYSALAIIYLMKQEFSKYYEMIQKVVQEQFKKTKNLTDMNALTTLAEHYLYKGDFTRAEKLAQKALKQFETSPEVIGQDTNLENNEYLNEIKSRMYFVLGQVHHSKKNEEDFEQAENNYRKAIKLFKNNFPAQYALGQIYYKSKQYQQSAECLEILIKRLKENQAQECYLILPHLYMRMNQKKETVKSFEKAMKYFPKDISLQIQYCTFLETYNTKKAYAVYMKLWHHLQMEENKEHISVELLNNISIIMAECGSTQKALEINQQCLQKIDEKNNEAEQQSIRATILYNQSYIYLCQKNHQKAKLILFKLIQEMPFFIQAYIQLAQIFYEIGEHDNMNCYLNQALFLGQKCSQIYKSENVFFSMLYYLIEVQNYDQATYLLKQVKVEDLYYYIVKATLYYYYVVNNRDKEQDAKAFIKAAAEICRKILINQPQNYQAANLVGALLAERGRLGDATYIYDRLQDVLEKGHSFLYNIALGEFLKSNFEKSIIILESPKSSIKIKNNELYPLVLTALKEFDKAEIKWKFFMKRNPSFTSQYYFCTFLHEKSKKYFQKKTKNVFRLKQMLKELDYCLQSFQHIFSLISAEEIKSLSKDLNALTIQKRKLKMIKVQCDQQMFFLRQNMENYQKVILEEEARSKLQKQSKIDRKMILENKLMKELRDKEQQESRRKKDEEEMERKAQENMVGVDEFQIEWGAKKIKEKEKKSKVEKMIDEQEKNRKKREKENMRLKKKSKVQEGDQKLELKNDNLSSSSEDESYDPNNLGQDEEAIDFSNYQSDSNEEQEKEQSEKQQDLKGDFMLKKKRTKLMVDDDDEY